MKGGFVYMELKMATNGVTVQKPTTNNSSGRNTYISSLAMRATIALIISWLIIMAFFVSSAVSH